MSADARVQDLADRLVEALRLPTKPGSIEIHYSSDGLAQKVDVHAVGWKSQLNHDHRTKVFILSTSAGMALARRRALPVEAFTTVLSGDGAVSMPRL